MAARSLFLKISLFLLEFGEQWLSHRYPILLREMKGGAIALLV
ncbi:MAG: hypothetical protein AB4290_22595 [Spirulina sp.]